MHDGSAAPPVERLTMMFADLEGSTRLAQRLGREWPEVLTAFRAIMRSAIAGVRGRVEHTEGDSFFAVFAAADDALRAARAAAEALERHPAGLRVRIGLHTGELSHLDGHYVGLEVHRAARLGSAANGGQVLLSAATVEALRTHVALDDLGLHRLKDFDEPQRLYALRGDSPAAAPRALPHRTTADELVEREAELAAIDAALARTSVGEGGVVVIEAPAGCGKTALLRAARERATGFDVLVGRGGELERAAGFGLVRDLFAMAVFRDGELRGLTGAAQLAEPLFAPRPQTAPAPDAAALHHGLYWLTADLAGRRPLLLIVDDAQWADDASLRFLDYLARRIETLPCVLLVGWRPGEPEAEEALVGRLLALPGAVRLAPQPLTADGCAHLVRRAAGAAVPSALIAACHRSSAGNPLLVRELAAALAEGAPVADADGEASVPARVRSIVRARLERLPQPARGTARALAVLGSEGSEREVAELAGLGREDAASALDLLTAANLVTRDGGVQFVHPLIRRAVYDDLPAGARGAAHERAARLLARAGRDAEVVAGHLLRAPAGAAADAARLLAEAARCATGRGAPRAAAEYLRRALEEPDSTRERQGLELALGRALVRCGARAEGREVLGRARDNTEDPAARLQIAIEMAHADMGLDFERIGEELPVALAEGAAADPDAAMIGQAFVLAARKWSGPDWAQDVARARLMLRDGPKDVLGYRVLAGFLANGACTDNQPVEAIRELALAAVRDERAYQQDLAAGWQHGMALDPLWVAGEWELAAHRVEQALAAARRSGSPVAVRNATADRMVLRAARGELNEAEADGALVLELAREHPWMPGLASFGMLADALIDRSPDRSQALIDVLHLDAEVPAVFIVAPLLLARSRLRIVQGRPAEAVTDAELARRLLATTGARPAPFISVDERHALALAAAGRRDEAVAVADDALRLAHEHGGPGPIGIALRARALVVRGAEAVGELERAATLLDEAGRRVERARTLVELGALLRRQRAPAASRPRLAEGRELAHRCGADALAERALQELRAAGARPRRIERTGVEALTASERRVAELAARGMTTRTIAEQLFLSQKTIETHLRQVYRKLGISGRRQLGEALSAGDGAG